MFLTARIHILFFKTILFNKEYINIISWIKWVQCPLVIIDFRDYKLEDCLLIFDVTLDSKMISRNSYQNSKNCI